MRLGDEELLRLAREHPGALAVFRTRFERPTLAYFRRRVGDAQTALDLTSATFAHATLECGKGVRVHDAASWLFAIAKRRLADHESRLPAPTRRSRRVADDAVEPSGDDLALLAVSSVLRGLPADCRAAVIRPDA
jgi:DNA-directed RNA polymerase specialized sigma24 family protein